MNQPNKKLLLLAAFAHLFCWLGGDLLLYFVPNGPLDIRALMHFEKAAAMLKDAPPLQFTISGVVGLLAMMLAFPGYLQIARLIENRKLARIVQAGAVLTCVAGAAMHYLCTTMVWYFVQSGTTPEAHAIMIRFFLESLVPVLLCNAGVFMVCISLLAAVVRSQTPFPRKAWPVNTLVLTCAVGILLGGTGAMNVGSALMFAGLFSLLKKQENKEKPA